MSSYKCITGIFDDYYIIYNDMYISMDDIFTANNATYLVTGIDDEFNVYLAKNNTHSIVLDIQSFISLLQQGYKYIRNRYQENIEKNIQICNTKK